MAKRAGGGDHVCESPAGDREKRLKCEHSRPPQVFQKILTLSDIEESNRVYIPKSDAAKSFPELLVVLQMIADSLKWILFSMTMKRSLGQFIFSAMVTDIISPEGGASSLV
jgi:hypothetical protein